MLVAGEHLDTLHASFGRYEREYAIRTATTAAEAEHAAQEWLDAGGTVALFVTDSVLPDAHVLAAERSVSWGRAVTSSPSTGHFRAGRPTRLRSVSPPARRGTAGPRRVATP